ncbi:MAG TPA: hypothetical protein PLJ60_05435 [Chryseolinea sp.]|nr:hypothetical protein [Chryseolinea sp.]HPM29760.1 hypothetical protein [Chryseolinea sp.]
MSPPLGDQFPEEFKKQFASQNLKVGSVLRALVTDTTPPKIKRFIVIGLSADKLALGTIYINTEINPNVFQSAELKNLHIKLEAAGREYLDHDSFVDCSKIFEKEYDTILKMLAADAGMLMGELKPDDIKMLKQK